MWHKKFLASVIISSFCIAAVSDDTYDLGDLGFSDVLNLYISLLFSISLSSSKESNLIIVNAITFPYDNQAFQVSCLFGLI